MSGSIQLESLLVAQQPKGMDLKKGVPTSKDGEEFADILNTEVEAAESVEKTELKDGAVLVAGPKDEKAESEVDAEEASVSPDSISNLLVTLVQQEVASLSEKERAALMENKVVQMAELTLENGELVSDDKTSADVGGEISEAAPVSLAEMNIEATPQESTPISLVPDVKPVMPKQSEPVVVSKEESSSVELEDVLSKGESREVADLLKKEGSNLMQQSGDEQSRPMDLRSFSESLFIQSNLLKSDAVSFEGEIQKLQAGDASGHVKTQIMREIEPMMTRVLLSDTGGEMTIQLKPNDLGSVRVDVQVDGDFVKVNFQAENSATRSVLQSQVQDLKQAMNQIGLKVDQVQVGTLMTQENPRNGQSQSQQQQPQQHQGPRHEQQQQQQAAREYFEDELMEMSA